MRFRVCEGDERIFFNRNMIKLQCDDVEDFGFRTSFTVFYYDMLGREHYLGKAKIGVQAMKPGCIWDLLPKEFNNFPSNYFSLGQEDLYYENISNLGEAKREEILTLMRDIAFDRAHYAANCNETVMQKSVMRNISTFTLNGQLHRMALGGKRQINYQFSYVIQETELLDQTKMDFKVNSASNPPTNVHVLIGRNGTGKTHLIKNMIGSIRYGDNSWGAFDYGENGKNGQNVKFANVVCVAFSPFDDFSELGERDSSVPWSFIGLNKKCPDLRKAIEDDFFRTFSNCALVAWKRRLWRECMEMLKSDPAFTQEHIDVFIKGIDEIKGSTIPEEIQTQIKETFSRLSSGHKVVILIITGCVDKIEEQSIVFVDEPENHLHPPLLSALIRTLSSLLISRNGVAIVATHSPVVLQEVPSSCVWTLHKYGQYLKAERPLLQTFGATIGSLTKEVFGLEVTDSGFHKLLYDAVNQARKEEQGRRRASWRRRSYAKISMAFGKQLGEEAAMVLWSLLSLWMED